MKQDYPHFRRLWNRVVAALMGAAFIPMVVIGGIFSFYAVSIYKTRSLEMLARDTDLRRQHLDRMLREHVAALKLVARIPVDILSRQDRFEEYSRTLIQDQPWIHDLEVFDSQGNQLVHMGFLSRETRNYADRLWFRQARAEGVWISDVELGYRQFPHISISVRRGQLPSPLILRASLDADHLRQHLKPRWESVTATDVFLVDDKGDYQARSQPDRRLMVPSGLGRQERFEGIRLHEADGRIQLTAWLSSVPWMLAASYDAREVFAPVLEMRCLAGWALVLGGIIIVFLVLLTADTLVKRLENKRQRIQHLNGQLQRSSYLSSTMELGIGFLEEMTDRLASITVAAQWLEKHLSGKTTAQDDDDLRQIRESAVAGRTRLKQFLADMRPRPPVITDVDMAEMIETVAGWLEKELNLRCIRVVWDVDATVPTIRTDAGKLRHAVQNILLNALAAVDRHGEIHITIAAEGTDVAVTITDNGCGILPKDHERIFEPLYTTKADGTGLGLPVARDIFQTLGGSLILLRSDTSGTAFRMLLPIQFAGASGADGHRRPADTV